AQPFHSPGPSGSGAAITNHSGLHASNSKAVPKGGNGKGFAVAPALQADESAALRDRLFAEMATLSSVETAATWARRVLGAKNNLAAADAQLVEEAFRARLARIEIADQKMDSTTSLSSNAAPVHSSFPPTATDPTEGADPVGVDKSRLSLP